MKFRKLLTAGLIVAMSASLMVGCGNKSTEDAKPKTEESSKEETEEKEVELLNAKESDENKAAVKALEEAREKNPDMHYGYAMVSPSQVNEGEEELSIFPYWDEEIEMTISADAEQIAAMEISLDDYRGEDLKTVAFTYEDAELDFYGDIMPYAKITSIEATELKESVLDLVHFESAEVITEIYTLKSIGEGEDAEAVFAPYEEVNTYMSSLTKYDLVEADITMEDFVVGNIYEVTMHVFGNNAEIGKVVDTGEKAEVKEREGIVEVDVDAEGYGYFTLIEDENMSGGNFTEDDTERLGLKTGTRNYYNAIMEEVGVSLSIKSVEELDISTLTAFEQTVTAHIEGDMTIFIPQDDMDGSRTTAFVTSPQEGVSYGDPLYDDAYGVAAADLVSEASYQMKGYEVAPGYYIVESISAL